MPYCYWTTKLLVIITYKCMEDDGNTRKKNACKLCAREEQRDTEIHYIHPFQANSSNSTCINTVNMVLYAYLPNDIEYLNMMLKLSIIAHVLCLIWDHAILPYSLAFLLTSHCAGSSRSHFMLSYC